MSVHLPTHCCQSTYCTNSAGYWNGQIVLIGRPQIQIIGWCNLCMKYVCGDCALRIEISADELKNLPGAESIESLCQKYNVSACRLHCKRCGTPLQKGENQAVHVLIP